MSNRKYQKLWFQVVKKNNKDELWFSPPGTKQKFFLTAKKISWEEIKQVIRNREKDYDYSERKMQKLFY
jgi:hypothetical protein